MPLTEHGPPSPSGHEHRTGIILDRGWRYDLEVWFFDTFLVRGRIGELRRLVLELAELASGSRLLDVGCGTGTLAIAAARRLRGCGQVAGVDPAPRQVERARAKARRSRMEVDFKQGTIEDLPFPDESFDVVTSTLMMHHLPVELQRQGLGEIKRVLRPAGRLIIADFDYVEGADHHREPARNGHGGAHELPSVLQDAGFTVAQTRRIAFPKAHRGWSGVRILALTK